MRDDNKLGELLLLLPKMMKRRSKIQKLQRKEENLWGDEKYDDTLRAAARSSSASLPSLQKSFRGTQNISTNQAGEPDAKAFSLNNS